MSYTDILLNEANYVANKLGITLATLGTRVADKGNFFSLIQDGSTVTIAKYERVMDELHKLKEQIDSNETHCINTEHEAVNSI